MRVGCKILFLFFIVFCNLCFSFLCKNNSICIVYGNFYVCICFLGFIGINCECK